MLVQLVYTNSEINWVHGNQAVPWWWDVGTQECAGFWEGPTGHEHSGVMGMGDYISWGR